MSNMSALATLATLGGATQDEFTAHLGEGNPLTAALEAARERRKVAAAEQLGELLEGFLGKMETYKQSRVQQIRALRSQVSSLKGELSGIDRAWAYACETQNFIPFARLLGYRHMSFGMSLREFESLSTVPADWAPSPTESSEG